MKLHFEHKSTVFELERQGEPLSADQKHTIILALIALAAFGLCVVMVWIAASLCGNYGLLLALLVVTTIFIVTALCVRF